MTNISASPCSIIYFESYTSSYFVHNLHFMCFLGPDVRRDKPVTGDQIEVFANKLGEQWKILAPYLEMKDSEIRQIECDSEDMKMRAKQLLVAWQDQEGVHATPENLISALNKSGLSALAESLPNDNETNS